MSSVLTDEARAVIRAQLEALRDAEKAIETAREPFDAALNGIQTARELLLEPYEGEYRTCEGCGGLILGGEPSYYEGDSGLVFCADCAPTYGDWKTNAEIIVSEASNRDAEEVAEAREGLAAITDHLAAGGSLTDKLPTSPL